MSQYFIPENPELKNLAKEPFIDKAREILEQKEEERLLKEGTIEFKLDNSNKVSFPGFPYTFEALHEKILVSIDIFKTGYECKTCKGKKKVEVKRGRESTYETCVACAGLGATLFLPDGSKNLPTTGVVVSMGKVAKEKADYKIGDRILFGAYAGTMIPTKVGLMFKYMDWNLGVLKIEGAEEMAAFDFILQADE
jgi:co-chaperonin GroES (HSP10)